MTGVLKRAIVALLLIYEVCVAQKTWRFPNEVERSKYARDVHTKFNSLDEIQFNAAVEKVVKRNAHFISVPSKDCEQQPEQCDLVKGQGWKMHYQPPDNVIPHLQDLVNELIDAQVSFKIVNKRYRSKTYRFPALLDFMFERDLCFEQKPNNLYGKYFTFYPKSPNDVKAIVGIIHAFEALWALLVGSLSFRHGIVR